MKRRFTEEDAAYAAAAWASGLTQREVARQFGYRTSASICVFIGKFLDCYAPYPVRYGVNDPIDDYGLTYGEARKALVPQALKAFRVRREVSLTKGTTP
jgi:hypothetical protein